MPKTIVSVSHDQILLETRAAILRKSGHHVFSATDLDEFAELLRDREVDLVVIGHTLNMDERDAAYRLIDEWGCKSPVIELYAAAAPPASRAHFQLAVHDVTFQTDLLQLVRQVLTDAQN
jgi:DNA-binding response OmpR family regulator